MRHTNSTGILTYKRIPKSRPTKSEISLNKAKANHIIIVYIYIYICTIIINNKYIVITGSDRNISHILNCHPLVFVLVVLFYSISSLFRPFNVRLSHLDKKFRTLQFCLHSVNCQKQFYFKQFSLAYVRCLNVKTVQFHVIQFSKSTQFRSIWPINRTLWVATTPGPIGPGRYGNEGIL